MKTFVFAARMVLVQVAAAWAGNENGPAPRVPEPTTLALLSAGAAAVAVGTRWFRRK
jgi:hypothetical protein